MQSYILIKCFQLCFITVDRLIVNNNDDVARLTVKVLSERNTNSIMNVTIEFKEVTQKLTAILTMNVPESENDQNYRREYFKSSVDVEKIFDGKFGSFIVKSFMENFIKSMEFVPKFPFEKVLKRSFKHPLIIS